MKGIYFKDRKVIFYNDLPIPIPNEKESLIKIKYAAICNTDKEIMRGYRPDFTGVMGHEFVGIVMESPKHELIGKKVIGELNASCGECIYCKTGRSSHCNQRKVIGMHEKDGCFAEYMTLDTDLLHVIPDELAEEIAIYTEPLAAAYEILTQLELSPEKNIAVLGDGRLSYCIVQALFAEGYRVTVVGKHPEKLKLFSPYAEVTEERVMEGYEIVIEATGSETGIVQALAMVRKKGTIILKSTYAGNTQLPMSTVVVNEITIIGSRCGPFIPALSALSEERVKFPPIKLYRLEEYEKAFCDTTFKVGFRIEEK